MEEECTLVQDDVIEQQNSLLSYKVRALEEKTLGSATDSSCSSVVKKYNKSKMDQTLSIETNGVSEDSILKAQEQIRLNELLALREKQRGTPVLMKRSSKVGRGLKSSRRSRNHTQIGRSEQLSSPAKRRLKESSSKPMTFKFVRASTSGADREKLIYQPKISSIFEINGQGTLLFSDGTSMEGFWVCGTPSDCLKIKYPNKSQYYGEVYNLKCHGNGEMVYGDGEKYIGEFCYGQLHGEGKFYDAKGRLLRHGQWRRGKYLG